MYCFRQMIHALCKSLYKNYYTKYIASLCSLYKNVYINAAKYHNAITNAYITRKNSNVHTMK